MSGSGPEFLNFNEMTEGQFRLAMRHFGAIIHLPVQEATGVWTVHVQDEKDAKVVVIGCGWDSLTATRDASALFLDWRASQELAKLPDWVQQNLREE